MIDGAKMFYNGNEAMKEFVKTDGNNIFINQTAQITDNSNLCVEFSIIFEHPCNGKVEFKPQLIH